MQNNKIKIMQRVYENGIIIDYTMPLSNGTEMEDHCLPDTKGTDQGKYL